MGVVYRARDEHLERDVAIKVLPAGTFEDAQVRARFRREALALSKLNHPGIATVYDFDTREGIDFLVMEYVPGETLEERLAGEPLDDGALLKLGLQLAEALAAAHAHGVVHRDLKPANLRLTPEGRLKVLDFGLAKLVRTGEPTGETATVTRTRGIVGTIPYMAPEQLRGETIDARTDVFATGAVLYEAATGHRPHPETQSAQLIDAVLNRPPEAPRKLRSDLSPDLERVILKALEKDPKRRYQSATEITRDLERMAAGRSVTAPAVGRARVVRLGLAAFAAVLAALALVFALNVGGIRDRLFGRPRIQSIAVLPLENLSGDPDKEYVADGITESLITDLGKIGALRVIARPTVMQYKNAGKTLPEIASELNVQSLLLGAVIPVGERVQITAQLIDPETEKHLWADRYERDVRDVLILQGEVARAIAAAIQITLTPDEAARLTTERRVDPEAHDAYLRGRHQYHLWTPEGWRRSIESFERAIAIDPDYALAYSGLSDAYMMLGHWNEPPLSLVPKARAAAEKALELDPYLGEAYASMGHIRWEFDRDWDGAERDLLRAIELNPSSSLSHGIYGSFLISMGRPDEGLEEKQRAYELDQLFPVVVVDQAKPYLYSGRYDRAIEELLAIREVLADPAGASGYLFRAYVEKGMFEEALAEASKVGHAEWLGYLHARAGRSREAEEIVRALEKRSETEYVQPTWIARIHGALGNTDEAFAWLEKAIEERDREIAWLSTSPEWTPLRSHPRFQEILRRLDFPN
jgi:TolB-like protein